MSEVPARSAALAADLRRTLSSRVIDDMLQAGEDVSDTVLYRRRRAEALAALRRELDREEATW